MSERKPAGAAVPGNSGARMHKRRYRPRRQGITESYRKLLTEKDPQTGKTYAMIVAESCLNAFLAGDMSAIFVMLDSGARKTVQAAMDKLVSETGCSPLAAKMALSLFSGEAILHGEDVLNEATA